MKILHVVPGLDDKANGIAVAAKLLAAERPKHEIEVVETRDFMQPDIRTLEHYSEVWVHSMWLPQTMLACWRALRIVRRFECSDARPRLVRMIHGNLDPVRLGYHGWKKRLVGPIERWLLRRCDRIVATCEAERVWIQAYVGKGCPEVVVEDLKRFFKLDLDGRGASTRTGTGSPLHLLYLGRRHPLKGVEYLERAVAGLTGAGRRTMELRIVSDHFGEALERDWAWCDVLVLPTLSENFGLVVAEALERGKYVITTDGAPAWEPDANFSTPNNYTYIRGYRNGTDEERVSLLKGALGRLLT